MKFVGTISRGGFGRVERVQLSDGRFVARKVFDPAQHVLERSDLTKLRARFAREVRVQSSLPSEYFLPILESQLDADQPWFTMPLADRNYSQEIKGGKRQRKAISTQPFADILNALEELHSLGYVHRRQQVLARARRAADRTAISFAVLVTESVGCVWSGLEPVV